MLLPRPFLKTLYCISIGIMVVDSYLIMNLLLNTQSLILQPVTPFASLEWVEMEDVASIAPEVKRVSDSGEQDADEGHKCGPVELRRLGEGHCYNVPEGSRGHLSYRR